MSWWERSLLTHSLDSPSSFFFSPLSPPSSSSSFSFPFFVLLSTSFSSFPFPPHSSSPPPLPPLLQTTPILDNTELVLNETRDLLSNLTARLQLLQEQIANNERELERTRNLTEEGRQRTNQANEVRVLNRVSLLGSTSPWTSGGRCHLKRSQPEPRF